MMKMIIDQIEDKDDRELIEVLKELLDERREQELAQELKFEELEHYRETKKENESVFTDEDLKNLLRMLDEYRGKDFDGLTESNDENDAEMDKRAKEYLKKVAPRSLKGKKFKPGLLEEKIERIKEKFPELAEDIDALKPKVPRSLDDETFFPDMAGHEAEHARIASNIGLYPRGFRHYQNYEMYRRKFPNRTIADYTEDSKSQSSS